MRKTWWVMPIVGAAIWGCGGSEVLLAQYSATVVSVDTETTAVDMATGAGGTFLALFSGTESYVARVGGPTNGLGNQLSGDPDLIAKVTGTGLTVGNDQSNTPGQGGLQGNNVSWTENTAGLTLGTDYLRFEAISPNGNTVGFRRVTSGTDRFAVRRVGSTNTQLVNPTNFRPNLVSDVNDSGKMVGSGMIGTEMKAWMSQGNDIVDLGLGFAAAVNANGVVVGSDGNNRPFRTFDGVSSSRVALPLLPGFTIGRATDINDDGIVVGWQKETLLSDEVPVAWYLNGALLDLRQRIPVLPAGITLLAAVSIDNEGRILLQGRRTSPPNEKVAVLLTLIP